MLLVWVYLMRQDLARLARGEPERSPTGLMLGSGPLGLGVGVFALTRGLRENDSSFTVLGVMLLGLTAVMAFAATRMARKTNRSRRRVHLGNSARRWCATRGLCVATESELTASDRCGASFVGAQRIKR
jgi:hypothetical protein